MGAFTRQRNSDYDGENMNVNVTWVSYPLFWAFYVLSIGLFRWALIFVPDTYISPEYAWTVTSIVHGVVRFWRCFSGDSHAAALVSCVHVC